MIAVCAIALSCDKDDPDAEACEGGVFEMAFNGEHVVSSTFNNTLIQGTSAGSAGKRMDVRATDADGRQLIITFTDLSTAGGNCVSTDEYISFDDITTGTENTFMFTVMENGVSESFTDGTLDITSCDADARKISGTFSFSFGDTEVSDGSFKDLCYKVL